VLLLEGLVRSFELLLQRVNLTRKELFAGVHNILASGRRRDRRDIRHLIRD
jgi:hypothetical protein